MTISLFKTKPRNKKSIVNSNQHLLVPLEEPALDLLLKPRSINDFINDDYSPYSNQALEKFVKSNSTGNVAHVVNPLPENLVAGKNTYAYDAHTYHTKVPPEAIVRLIEHYTEPGELILDPFCGSGMTGLAALRTKRKPILIDLSPAATFIAVNFLTPVIGRNYLKAIRTIIDALHNKEMMLYGTHCRTCGKLVPMEYTVWSYGVICSFCSKEFVLWDVARDEHENIRESKVKTEFDCSHCGKHLKKRLLQRTKLYPVQIGYRCCSSGLQESKDIPDKYDLDIIGTTDVMGIPEELWHPNIKFHDGVNTRQAIAHGFDSVDALYTKRNLYAIAMLWDFARRWRDKKISLKLLFTVTSLYQRVTRLSEFRFWGGSGNIANYNVPMIFNEQNVFKVFYRKAKTIQNYFETWDRKPDAPFCISTQSANDLHSLPANSIDYIFTDPPFGSNINYSEMNYIWEAWLNVFTDTKDETIINRVYGKTIDNYRELMRQALCEMYRVLKPGRWLTLMFHNSSSEVWAAIQIAILSSGFAIEKIQTLDKRHGTFKQFVSENVVGYDLILHCRKNMNGVPSTLISQSKKTSYFDIREFIEQKLKPNPDEFIVRYLHVKRKKELDSRKLYSLWVKERIESEKTVNLDYGEFRQIVNQIIRTEFLGTLKSRAEQIK